MKTPDKTGIALITSLMVGALLFILAGAFLNFLVTDYHANRTRQQALQAHWNARAGLEHYLHRRELPARQSDTGKRRVYLKSSDALNYWEVKHDAKTGDLRFIGVSGQVTRTLKLLGGRPDRRVEEL